MAKRKYNRGHRVEQRWVFGMYDVHSGMGILEFVEDRTQATLLPIIQALAQFHESKFQFQFQFHFIIWIFAFRYKFLFGKWKLKLIFSETE